MSDDVARPTVAEDITISANPFAEDDAVCSEFFDELTPWEHPEFLRRLTAQPPGIWVRLVDVCEGVESLPECYEQIRSRLADKVVVSYVAWPGAALDASQPKFMVLIGNVQSMYADNQLLSPAGGD